MTVQYKTADPHELEVPAAPLEISLGVDEASLAAPRPDLNGLRIKSPANSAIYLIMDGYRRWIPDPLTYTNLFRDWNGVVVDINVGDIPQGPALTSGAVLAKGAANSAVYLVSNHIKRWITSPAAMNKYYFAWNRIVVVPQILVDSINTGGNLG